MANPSAAHEPSMEEILASIRQIISEDTDRTVPASKSDKARSPKDAAPPVYSAPQAGSESATAAAPASAGTVPTPAQLSAAATRSASKIDTPSPAPRPDPAPLSTAADSDKRPLPGATEPRRDPVAAPTPASSDVPSDTGKLLSEHSKAAVESAFGALAHTILAQNARTLEDIVADMMRPMLKTWLDTNLPSLVERLVREEIERVSRGRR